MSMTRRRALLASVGVMAPIGAMAAGATGIQARYIPRQQDQPEMLSADPPGFESMFDGKTFDGWDGDPTYWRVENGIMVGEITPSTVVKSNTFIIWRGGAPSDFDLRVEVRISEAGNSGINYRSSSVPDPVTPTNRHALKGYQCDIDGRNRFTGNNYEEKGRMFLAVRGQVTQVRGTQRPFVLGQTGESAALVDTLATIQTDFTPVQIVARGDVLTHIINNKVMSIVIDDDERERTRSGLIGVQVHVGPPMKVEYRNWRIRVL